MFTIDQIKAAHSKVRSGADFPAYILQLKELGVTYYETFVTDGHSDYYGADHFKATSPAKYDRLAIATTSNDLLFRDRLKAHQEGQTDYPTFCRDAAGGGIEKWAVCMTAMTCTYFDKAGKKILMEEIPAPKGELA